ncbi:xanthine dehydrogenase family protein molybdopterin-binding subunit [Paeniglutamicibacter gangotriensis]|uniref:xanthine dehydrogenase family protein molybdopterin-binding subunit n=1 Tax=Paeniglutamicibacter gangotriensis TaxID=254787 RepID=UPI002AA29D47|nr:molybdopterin cofactor-binding domain-containing protein [Paeniglutamicibacter gangotriensis]
MGTDLRRLDGVEKVRGTAPYAYDQPVDDPVYLYPVQSSIAKGSISRIDTAAAASIDGVIAVLTHENAPRLAVGEDAEYAVLQGPEVGFRGQFVGAVIARTPQAARHAASLVLVHYEAQEHDVFLTAQHPGLYAPAQANGGIATDTSVGDVEAALADAAVVIDHSYRTPAEHNNPMEPHTTVAVWSGGELTLYDSTQGVHPVRQAMAPLFSLEPGQVHVIAPHVGGGFGSKGLPHAHVVLAALAAKCSNGRPVKFALTRQQMFALAGYRTPTIQHVRLGATVDGRLTAISQEAVAQTSRIKEFVEPTAEPARMMYAAGNRRTTHRVAALDVPIPSWMRAPGGVSRDVRPGSRHGRAGRGLRAGSDRAADPQRTGHRSRFRQAVLQPPPARMPRRRRRALRLGEAFGGAAQPARGPVAGGAGRRRCYVSVQPHRRERRADRIQCRFHPHGADRRG